MSIFSFFVSHFKEMKQSILNNLAMRDTFESCIIPKGLDLVRIDGHSILTSTGSLG